MTILPEENSNFVTINNENHPGIDESENEDNVSELVENVAEIEELDEDFFTPPMASRFNDEIQESSDNSDNESSSDRELSSDNESSSEEESSSDKESSSGKESSSDNESSSDIIDIQDRVDQIDINDNIKDVDDASLDQDEDLIHVSQEIQETEPQQSYEGSTNVANDLQSSEEEDWDVSMIEKAEDTLAENTEERINSNGK